VKKSKHLYWIIPLLLVAVAGAFFFIPQIQQTEFGKDSKYIESPSFGYISCLPAQGGQTTKSFTFGAAAKTTNCAEGLGINDGCTFRLIPPDKFAFSRREFGYSINGGAYIFLEGGISGYSGEQDAVNVQLKGTDTIRMYYGEVGGLSGNLLSEGQSYKITGNSFTLYNVNSASATTGQPLAGSRVGSCVLENNYYKNKQINFADPSIQELKGADTKTFDFSSLNQPYGTYTYFAYWNTIPTFGSQIEIVNGQEAYCMDRQLFKTLPITVNGFAYKIVNYDAGGYIKSVTCCNGEEAPDKLCVNHEFVDKDKVECNAGKGIFCPQSTYQPYGDAQYKRFECVENKCVANIITVECNKDTDCSNGLTCARAPNPNNNQCVERGTGAGSPEQKVSFTDSLFGMLSKYKVLALILASLLTFIGSFVWLSKSLPKDKAVQWVVSILLGGIVGLLVYFLIVWILWILAGAVLLFIVFMVIAMRRK